MPEIDRTPTESDTADERRDGRCKVCHKDIKISIFKDGLWCSDFCRKVYTGEIKAGLR